MNKYNLQDLLGGHLEILAAEGPLTIKFDGVRIPMIQRDYAQGRTDQKELRERFLSALFEAIAAEKELELDFVYGSVESQDNSQYFIPLDGQQRLTTLFLLSWYIGQRELSEDELQEKQQMLARFSYHTRASARDFCEALCRLKRIDFEKTPAEIIRQASWFYGSFKKDPTVQSMLHMLDAIHQHYGNVQGPVYAGLSRLKFYILPLDGFGLTDELYIKMNARGKPLTDFENFKADLINWMTDIHNPEAALFSKDVTYDKRLMPYSMAVSLKFDNAWTSFFWSFTKGAGEEDDKLVDPLFLRFFNRLLLNLLILSSPLTQDALEKSDTFAYFYGSDQKDKPVKYSSYSVYEPLIGSFSAIKKVENILDNIADYYPEISALLPPSWNNGEKWDFFRDEISQTQRILFLGICVYLQSSNFEPVSFRQWIRVVWNIIINPDIRSIPAMISAMRLINDLAPHAASIYTYLGSDASAPLEERHGYTEFTEERLKAALILENADWEAALISGEAHPLFQGSVGFLLADKPSIGVFKRRVELSNSLFDKGGATGYYGEDHRLMRATISCIARASDLVDRFKMEDSDTNWALLLRRSQTARQIISLFCSLDDEAILHDTVSVALNEGSAISWGDAEADNRRIREVHEQLYQPVHFHQWMQDRNAVGLVRRDEHFYVKKYRAWYDMVMLDTRRNELAALLIQKFGLYTKQRCANTDFFWGDELDLHKKVQVQMVTIAFDQHRTLRAGLRISENVLPEGAEMFSGGTSDPSWHFFRAYDYTGTTGTEQVLALAESIGRDIFDGENPDSLVAQLALKATAVEKEILPNG